MIACVSDADERERLPVGRVNGDGEEVKLKSEDGVEVNRSGGRR